MMELVFWTVLGMIYAGGLLGVIMAVGEKELFSALDYEKPRLLQMLFALILVLAWPAGVTAVLVYKALKS